MGEMAEAELTEFEAIEVESVKGVPAGANGFPHLLMKGLAKSGSPTAEQEQAGVPAWAHRPFDGDHAHDHPAFGGPDGDDDGVHGHEHHHDGDADHHHAHGTSKSAGPPLWHSPAALLVRLAGENRDKAPGDLFKAVAADGTVDEQPDIDGGKQAVALIAKLIGYEAQELEAGCLGETWDIQLLCDAIGTLRAWLSGEVAGQMADAADGTGVVMDSTAAPAGAAEGKPGESDAAKSAVAEGETAVDTDAQGTGSLAKAVEDAVTKAVGPLQERVNALGADLAKVLAAPVPGGPVLSNVRAAVRAEGGSDWAAKAAYFRSKAELAVSPADRDGYRQLAREADEKAQAPAITA